MASLKTIGCCSEHDYMDMLGDENMNWITFVLCYRE